MSKKKVKAKKQKAKRKYQKIILIVIIGVAIVLSAALYIILSPMKVGVLELPSDLRPSLEAAKNDYNAHRGTNKPLELIYSNNLNRFLWDPTVSVVIGPYRSDEMMKIAPQFIQFKKFLISPTATAADISRAYNSPYILRTVPSDDFQIQTIINILHKKNVKNIALLYDATDYGKTFHDWIGFYATEAHITVKSIQAVNAKNANYTTLIDSTLAKNPEYIVAAVYSDEAIAIKKELTARNANTKLFLTDKSDNNQVLKGLGTDTNNIEATGINFQKTSLEAVKLTVSLINHTSNYAPPQTVYSYDILQNGKWNTLATYPAMVAAKQNVQKLSTVNTQHIISPLKKTKAVIIATSNGWENYRHQSDAAAIYQMLKQNGMKDEDIIVMMVNDIAHNPQNNPPSSLFHFVGDQNNYNGLHIDYDGGKVTEENFTNVLLGIKTSATPKVLESDVNTNVFLYIADHGGDISQQAAKVLGGDLTPGSGVISFADANSQTNHAVFSVTDNLLTSEELGSITHKLSAQKRFRQMFVVVEACFSGTMGENIHEPNVLFMSAANEQEVSYAANYDPAINTWLADNFTYNFILQANQNPGESLSNFYYNVYENVDTSHVTVLNYANFSNLETTPISDFFK